ncbi:hypothetical protein ACIQ1D_18865 [Lysinibacillus xylanilyticus]|uniref:hypothetical protein n=1 Tax=Lysinibacillus xylanilyticus TaxID=582475 RepID=UPI0037F1E3F3
MMVTIWILFVFFGLFTLFTSIQYFVKKASLGWFHALMWFLSAIVTAICAGIIWGGLLSSINYV